MDEKNENIQIRVDGDLKEEFYKLAEKTGQSPSNLLRSLMRQAIEMEDKKVSDLIGSKRQLDTMMYEVLSFIHRSEMLRNDRAEWELYKKTFLPDYLDEIIAELLRDTNVTGEEFWRLYWHEVDKNWFTKFSESPPFRAVHVNRETMDHIHNDLTKKAPKGTTSGRN